MKSTVPSRPSVSRRAIVLALIAAGLAGCGKKGKLYPPEGEEDRYTHPQVYPKPSSQVPGYEDGRTEEIPEPDDISIFPGERARTKTY